MSLQIFCKNDNEAEIENIEKNGNWDHLVKFTTDSSQILPEKVNKGIPAGAKQRHLPKSCLDALLRVEAVAKADAVHPQFHRGSSRQQMAIF